MQIGSSIRYKNTLFGNYFLKCNKVKTKKISFKSFFLYNLKLSQNTPKKVSEYDQEIPQSQTADNPVAPQGRAAQPSRDIRKTN